MVDGRKLRKRKVFHQTSLRCDPSVFKKLESIMKDMMDQSRIHPNRYFFEEGLTFKNRNQLIEFILDGWIREYQQSYGSVKTSEEGGADAQR